MSRQPLHAMLDSIGRRIRMSGTRPTAQPLHAEYVFTRTELQPVLRAIRAALDGGSIPMDSPGRLQEALGTLIVDLGGVGEVTVRRSPAALLTPEYWQITLTNLDVRTHAAVDAVVRAGRP